MNALPQHIGDGDAAAVPKPTPAAKPASVEESLDNAIKMVADGAKNLHVCARGKGDGDGDGDGRLSYSRTLELEVMVFHLRWMMRCSRNCWVISKNWTLVMM